MVKVQVGLLIIKTRWIFYLITALVDYEEDMYTHDNIVLTTKLLKDIDAGSDGKGSMVLVRILEERGIPV